MNIRMSGYMRKALLAMGALIAFCASACSDKDEEDSKLLPEHMEEVGYHKILLTFPTLCFEDDLNYKFQSKIETRCALKRRDIEALHMSTSDILLSIPCYMSEGADYDGKEQVNDSTIVYKSSYQAAIKVAGIWMSLRPRFEKEVYKGSMSDWGLVGITISGEYEKLNWQKIDTIEIVYKDGEFLPYRWDLWLKK